MIKFFKEMAEDMPGLFVFTFGCTIAGAGFIIAAIINTIFYLTK